MIPTVVLAIVGTWLLLAVLTTVACAALARGGLHEDRARGYAPAQQAEADRYGQASVDVGTDLRV
jgi:hypothetical protein